MIIKLKRFGRTSDTTVEFIYRGIKHASSFWQLLKDYFQVAGDVVHMMNYACYDRQSKDECTILMAMRLVGHAFIRIENRSNLSLMRVTTFTRL